MAESQCFKMFFELEEGKTLNEIKERLVASRRILVVAKLDEEYTDELALMLIQLEHKEVAPITLLIDSKGGSVPDTYHLKNVIESLRSPVYGLVLRDAKSIAVDLLQMCERRMMLPHSRLFCHYIRMGFELIGDFDEVTEKEVFAFQSRVLRYKKEREKMYRERCGITKKEVDQLFHFGEKFDIHFSAEESLERGLIDEIVTDFKFFPDSEAKE